MNEINKALSQDIELIKSFSIKYLDPENIISIYLYGGYGRDEGSWVIEEVDGQRKVRPYNDYDIAIIVKKRFSLSKMRYLEDKLKENLDVQWVDICQYSKLQLKFFKVSIKNYDFKYASKWIYGRKDMLRYIPNMDVKSITLKDIETLYITRIWTLVGSFSKKGLVKMKYDEEMFFRNQMAKCILAIVDCVLVTNKEYDSSYKKRVEKLSNFSSDNELIDLAEWALAEKLFPRVKGMNNEEIKNLYMSVHRLFFKYIYSSLSIYYKSKVDKPEDIYKYIMYNPVGLLKEKVKKYLFNDKRNELNKHLIILQGHIIYYYFNMSDQRLKMISSIMKSRFSFHSNDLDELRLKVAQLRVEL